jgi:hypothetical protein
MLRSAPAERVAVRPRLLRGAVLRGPDVAQDHERPDHDAAEDDGPHRCTAKMPSARAAPMTPMASRYRLAAYQMIAPCGTL